MKKGLLLAVLAMITSITLAGCGQKSEEQPADDSSNTVATEEQKTDENSEDSQSSESKDESGTEEKKDETSQSVDLGEKTVEGESVEGMIYGKDKYRLTKGSDRIVLEWVKDSSTNKIEYVFEGDRLSCIKVRADYEKEDQAKAMYDSIMKNENVKKTLKNLKIEGNSVIYDAEDNQWAKIKDYTKDQVFEEQKKALKELEKVDDIRSDD